MDIRKAEDELFEEWRQHKKSFVIDGCPKPDVYKKEKRKVVFVLKDGNLGKPNLEKNCNVYNQRDELENKPTPWWETIARWSYFINNKSKTWCDAQNTVKSMESIRDILSHNCIVQMKKTWGGGSVKNNVLNDVVKCDKKFIYKQISIYEPNFVIACGNGEYLSKIFDCNNKEIKKTSTGVGYWEIKLENNMFFLVDYCHPSIRVGRKVKGIIAKGLSSAILEIEQNPNK